jgi:DNA-binding MarR family transcriptional regulator
MSSAPSWPELGLPSDEAAAMGPDAAARIRIFRLVLVLAQGLRTLMDDMLAADGLTTQQAALITVATTFSGPSLSQAAAVLGTSHQNVRQLASALERKGFLEVVADADDRRLRRLVPTLRSRDYWARRDPGDHARVLGWFAGLAEPEAEELLRLLLRLHSGVHAALADVREPGATRPDAP